METDQLAQLSKLWTFLFTWQFGVATLFIAAFMFGVKRTFQAAQPDYRKNHVLNAILTAGNMVLGFVVAIPQDFLAGSTYTQRMFVGMIAGMASNFAYHLLIKRLRAFTGVPKDGQGSSNSIPPPDPTLPPS